MGSAAENPLASTQLRRCRQCAAPARGEVSWCLQCYAPIEAGTANPGRTADQLESPIADQPAGVSAPMSAEDRGSRSRGRHSAGPKPLDQTQARELADQMIAQFTAAPIPAQNWVERLTASKHAGLFWAAIGLGIVAGTCLVLGTVIGLITN